MHIPRIFRKSFILAVLIALCAVGTALAFVTIDTDNGLDDWSDPAFLTDATGEAGAGYDIQNFWVGVDSGAPSNFYFRAELDAALPFNAYVEARLDCDHNGSFDDAIDMRVAYIGLGSPDADTVVAADPFFNRSDLWTPEYGEATGTVGAYEWRSPTSGGSTVWTNCTAGTIGVMLATVNGSNYTDQDTTGSRDFNVPTALKLASLQAGNPDAGRQTQLLWLALAFLAASGALGVFYLRRQRLAGRSA